MKKILIILAVVFIYLNTFGQDTLLTQQNFTKVVNNIKEVEDLKNLLKLLGLGSLTLIGVLGYMIFKFNKWGKELIKTRLEAVTTSVNNDFSKVRLAIITSNGQKRQMLVDELHKIGFDREKLNFYGVKNSNTIDASKNEFIFFDDENNALSETEIETVINTFETQIRYFYFGPKKVSNELYARLKIAANSKEFLESNFLKAIKV